MKEIDQHAKFQRAWLRDRLLIQAEGWLTVVLGAGLLAGGCWIGFVMSGPWYTGGGEWIAWSVGGLMGLGGCIVALIGQRNMRREARLAESPAGPENPFTNFCSDVFVEFYLATPWPENRSMVSFQHARFLLATGECEKARDIFLRIDSEMPGNAVIGFCLGQCDRMLGRHAEAVRRFDTMLAAHGWTGPATALLTAHCAEAFLAAGDFSETKRRMEKLTGLSVDVSIQSLLLDWLASRIIGSLNLDSRAVGMEMSRRAYELDPISVTRGLTLAWFLWDVSRDGNAEEFARAALRKSDSPTDQALGAFVIAKIQWQRGQTKEAERLAAFARYAMPEGPLRQTIEQPLANL